MSLKITNLASVIANPKGKKSLNCKIIAKEDSKNFVIADESGHAKMHIVGEGTKFQKYLEQGRT